MKKSKIVNSLFVFQDIEEVNLDKQLSLIEPFKITLKMLYTVSEFRFTNPKLPTKNELIV